MTRIAEKWIRLASGACYAYSPALAKRRDAVVVGPQEAADYYRTLGADNVLTQTYPATADRAPDTPPAPRKTRKRATKPPADPTPAPVTGVVMGDAEMTPEQIEALINGEPGGE